LKTLVGSNGIKRYREYLITEVSREFLPASKSEFRDVNHSVLDIAKDPLEKGFQPVYDVVLSVNATHASPNLQQALEKCQKLLKPGGKLVLIGSAE
jgi:SAM-dependent methyltransferase